MEAVVYTASLSSSPAPSWCYS